jgi:hypothetical protein
VVVPSTVDVICVSTAPGVETVGKDVCVDRGIGVEGNVAVMKSGVEVTLSALEIFRPQLEHTINTKRHGKLYLCCTSLL